MSNNAELLNVLYSVESSFAENLATFTVSLPLIDGVDLSGLAREKQMINFTRQYAHEGYQDILMPFVGKSIKLTGRLTGLGATAAGALPSSAMADFLAGLVGNATNGLATGGTFTGGTAQAPTTSMVSGIAAGALVHGGAIGDGRVGGQFIPVGTHATSILTALLAAPAAPNNGDLLYASRMVYPAEASPSAESLVTYRMQVLTSNGHYILRGVYMADFRITGLSPGEIPQWEATMGVAHVTTTSGTFPNATVAQKHASTPASNGSFAYNQVGTTARLTELVRSFALNIGDTGEGIIGTGGNFEGQVIQGCRRKPGKTTIEVVVDAEATGTYTWRDRANVDPNTAPFWHACYTVSAADGRAIGLYFPRLKIVNEPIQINDGGWNRTRIVFEALKGGTDTSTLTQSHWRMGLA